ncbi:MAG: hydrogenase expression protein [Dehalococcoidia bacterium]|nr:hydrogenase expression protein [Dehalococcoidia bacterium]
MLVLGIESMLPSGKIPSDLLRGLLEGLPGDPSVLVGPGVGLDAAILQGASGGRIVVAADPITFATRRPARYAVQVNANDIAVMGAGPRWFLATLLFPLGTSETDVRATFADLAEACGTLGVSLVGGQSEVTAAVNHTVVAGTMLGELPADGVLNRQVSAGDEAWLIGEIAIEGTAILCREAGPRLTAAGVSADVIAAGTALLDAPGISIVAPARAAAASGAVAMMHDPTEGGVAGALVELAGASSLGIVVDLEAIPVRRETRTVCAALGIDPLGLLASGALLLAVRRGQGDSLSAALTQSRFQGRPIGRFVAGGGVVDATGAPLPLFERDELARFLEQGNQPG